MVGRNAPLGTGMAELPTGLPRRSCLSLRLYPGTINTASELQLVYKLVYKMYLRETFFTLRTVV